MIKQSEIGRGIFFLLRIKKIILPDSILLDTIADIAVKVTEFAFKGTLGQIASKRATISQKCLKTKKKGGILKNRNQILKKNLNMSLEIQSQKTGTAQHNKLLSLFFQTIGFAFEKYKKAGGKNANSAIPSWAKSPTRKLEQRSYVWA